MAKTIEQLEAEVEALSKQFENSQMTLTDIQDLKDEIHKIQETLSTAHLPKGVETEVKKKLKRLKQKPWWKFMDDDEYEDVSEENLNPQEGE